MSEERMKELLRKIFYAYMGVNPNKGDEVEG